MIEEINCWMNQTAMIKIASFNFRFFSIKNKKDIEFRSKGHTYYSSIKKES